MAGGTTEQPRQSSDGGRKHSESTLTYINDVRTAVARIERRLSDSGPTSRSILTSAGGCPDENASGNATGKLRLVTVFTPVTGKSHEADTENRESKPMDSAPAPNHSLSSVSQTVQLFESSVALSTFSPAEKSPPISPSSPSVQETTRKGSCSGHTPCGESPFDHETSVPTVRKSSTPNESLKERVPDDDLTAYNASASTAQVESDLLADATDRTILYSQQLGRQHESSDDLFDDSQTTAEVGSDQSQSSLPSPVEPQKAASANLEGEEFAVSSTNSPALFTTKNMTTSQVEMASGGAETQAQAMSALAIVCVSELADSDPGTSVTESKTKDSPSQHSNTTSATVDYDLLTPSEHGSTEAELSVESAVNCETRDLNLQRKDDAEQSIPLPDAEPPSAAAPAASDRDDRKTAMACYEVENAGSTSPKRPGHREQARLESGSPVAAIDCTEYIEHSVQMEYRREAATTDIPGNELLVNSSISVLASGISVTSSVEQLSRRDSAELYSYPVQNATEKSEIIELSTRTEADPVEVAVISSTAKVTELFERPDEDSASAAEKPEAVTMSIAEVSEHFESPPEPAAPLTKHSGDISEPIALTVELPETATKSSVPTLEDLDMVCTSDAATERQLKSPEENQVLDTRGSNLAICPIAPIVESSESIREIEAAQPSQTVRSDGVDVFSKPSSHLSEDNQAGLITPAAESVSADFEEDKSLTLVVDTVRANSNEPSRFGIGDRVSNSEPGGQFAMGMVADSDSLSAKAFDTLIVIGSPQHGHNYTFPTTKEVVPHLPAPNDTSRFDLKKEVGEPLYEQDPSDGVDASVSHSTALYNGAIESGSQTQSDDRTSGDKARNFETSTTFDAAKVMEAARFGNIVTVDEFEGRKIGGIIENTAALTSRTAADGPRPFAELASSELDREQSLEDSFTHAGLSKVLGDRVRSADEDNSLQTPQFGKSSDLSDANVESSGNTPLPDEATGLRFSPAAQPETANGRILCVKERVQSSDGREKQVKSRAENSTQVAESGEYGTTSPLALGTILEDKSFSPAVNMGTMGHETVASVQNAISSEDLLQAREPDDESGLPFAGKPDEEILPFLSLATGLSVTPGADSAGCSTTLETENDPDVGIKESETRSDIGGSNKSAGYVGEDTEQVPSDTAEQSINRVVNSDSSGNASHEAIEAVEGVSSTEREAASVLHGMNGAKLVGQTLPSRKTSSPASAKRGTEGKAGFDLTSLRAAATAGMQRSVLQKSRSTAVPRFESRPKSVRSSLVEAPLSVWRQNSSSSTSPTNRTFGRVPRVAGLARDDTREKRVRARTLLPRGNTFSGSASRTRSTLGNASPKQRNVGLPCSPVTPQPLLEPENLIEEPSETQPRTRTTPRNRIPIRRTLSFDHIRLASSSAASIPSSTPVSPRQGPSSGAQILPRAQLAQSMGSPSGRGPSRRMTMSMSLLSGEKPPRFAPRSKPTVPQPFSLTGFDLHEKAQRQIEEARKKAEEDLKKRRVFKARPMPDFSKPYPKPHL